MKYRKEFRPLYAKFVYYNYNHVVCECHVSRRPDCEPFRTPVKKVKRLSQKSRKRRVFVWKRIVKITTLSSKLHGYNGWRLRSQIKRRRIISGLRFIKKHKEGKGQLSFDESFVQPNTLQLTCFRKYTGTRKLVNPKKYRVLYTCCKPMSLICTRIAILC